MNRRALFAALALLILVNAVVLLGVARNRSGEPDAVLTLTERELPLSPSYRHKENTGVSLRLNVNPDSGEQQWFDAGKLTELGFDTRRHLETERLRAYRVLPKKAFVVLEYDGEAWQRHRRRQREEIAGLPAKVRQGKLEPEEAEKQAKEKRFQLSVASHLFSVDAGPDPEALRRRWADRGRYLILPARVRLYSDRRRQGSDREEKWRLYGRVEQILVNELHVPRKLQGGLQTLSETARIRSDYTYFNPRNPARVRYRVRVAVGRRFEPWVMGIEIVDE
jgi:hypothetical protein